MNKQNKHQNSIDNYIDNQKSLINYNEKVEDHEDFDNFHENITIRKTLKNAGKNSNKSNIYEKLSNNNDYENLEKDDFDIFKRYIP